MSRRTVGKLNSWLIGILADISGGFFGKLVATLTADRAYTLPDATTTLAGLSVAQSWSGVQTFAAASTIIGVDPTGGEILRVGGSARISADLFLNGMRVYQVSTGTVGLVSAAVNNCFMQFLDSAGTSLGYLGGSNTDFGILTPGGSTIVGYQLAGDVIRVNRATFIGTDPGGSDLLRIGGALTISSTRIMSTKTSFTNGAAAAAGTLTNAPAAGNPTKWIPIDDNGTTRYIPAW